MNINPINGPQSFENSGNSNQALYNKFMIDYATLQTQLYRYDYTTLSQVFPQFPQLMKNAAAELEQLKNSGFFKNDDPSATVNIDDTLATLKSGNPDALVNSSLLESSLPDLHPLSTAAHYAIVCYWVTAMDCNFKDIPPQLYSSQGSLNDYLDGLSAQLTNGLEPQLIDAKDAPIDPTALKNALDQAINDIKNKKPYQGELEPFVEALNKIYSVPPN